MINENGEEVVADTVPDLVEALDQLRCRIHDDDKDCHRCTDLAVASTLLQLFDKLIALFNDDHRCLDASQCKICTLIQAYGLEMSEPQKGSNLVTVH